MMKRFNIKFHVTANLELADSVIDAVNDEWRANLYDLNTHEEIAEMIGRCMLEYRSNLSDLDGWADQPNKNAILSNVRWEQEEIREIH